VQHLNLFLLDKGVGRKLWPLSRQLKPKQFFQSFLCFLIWQIDATHCIFSDEIPVLYNELKMEKHFLIYSLKLN